MTLAELDALPAPAPTERVRVVRTDRGTPGHDALVDAAIECGGLIVTRSGSYRIERVEPDALVWTWTLCPVRGGQS